MFIECNITISTEEMGLNASLNISFIVPTELLRLKLKRCKNVKKICHGFRWIFLFYRIICLLNF